jgi:transcription initiation factor TFIID subunit 7
MLKLKLNARPTAPIDAPANEAPVPTSTTSTSAPKLSFKIKTSSAPTAEAADGPSTSTEQPKQKRKYTKKPKVDENGAPKAPTLSLKPSKKRLREEYGDDDSPAAKRKPKPTAKSLAFVKDEDMDEDEGIELVQRAPRPQPVRTQSMKLSFKPKGASVHKVIPLLKVKGAGKPPPRPPGVGYDSEAEEAEIDPAVESQFILRMQPGEDCDLLRKSIEEKTIGKPIMQGGPGVNFRFFDREGRRSMITIQGRYYAATMVELPCVVESMKSWNKKDWVKTADVCQMLLVLGRVSNEEEAKKFPLPREVNNSAHQYPHGLTPPMHWARKRRFRPRISYHRIEQVEEETEAQLAADRIIKEKGGRTEFEIIDAFHSDTESSSEDDAEGEVEEMYDAPQYGDVEGETPAAEAVDDSVLEEMLAAGFMEDDEPDGEGEVDGEVADEPDAVEPDMDDLFGDGGMDEPETPATSHNVAMHALGEPSNIGTETAASTPAADTDSPDADDDDESDEDDEIDEEAAAKQQQIEEIQAEIRELDQNIAGFISQRDTQKNVLMKERYQAKVDKQVADRDINLGKLRALGVEVD